MLDFDLEVEVKLDVNTLFVTFIATSLIWAILLIKEKDNTNSMNQIIAKQTSTINLLKYKLKDKEEEMEELDNFKFKYKLLSEFESVHKYNLSTKILDAVYTVSKETNYDLAFLLAWIETESNFKSNPKPWRNVKGILQVDYNIWKDELDLEISQMSDPYYNIKVGLQILERYKNRAAGDLSRALFYYNNGISGKYQNHKYTPKIEKREKFYQEILERI